MMAHERDKTEVVDLTQEESIVVTISDSPPPPPPPKPRTKRIEIVEVFSDDEETERQPPKRTRLSSPHHNLLKCPICIETFVKLKQGGSKCVTTRCGHLFCDNCLKKALKEQGRKCPKCRVAVPKANGYIEVFDIY